MDEHARRGSWWSILGLSKRQDSNCYSVSHCNHQRRNSDESSGHPIKAWYVDSRKRTSVVIWNKLCTQLMIQTYDGGDWIGDPSNSYAGAMQVSQLCFVISMHLLLHSWLSLMMMNHLEKRRKRFVSCQGLNHLSISMTRSKRPWNLLDCSSIRIVLFSASTVKSKTRKLPWNAWWVSTEHRRW